MEGDIVQLPEKAVVPTMYFIGVTTGSSSIMKLFPLWAKELGLDNAVLKGIDIEIHSDPSIYREVVEFIKKDELSLGALVTTHKIDIYNAARDMFEYLDPYAVKFGELSSISKKHGRLEGHAKDPISSGFAMQAFIPKNYWKDHGGEVMIMGAGGSALAISSYLMREEHGDNVPSKIIITNRSKPRLDSAREKLDGMNPRVKMEYHLCSQPGQNDEVLKTLKPYSLIVNATGMGKDRPGSPLMDGSMFPPNSLVWELNYRGDLKFLHQANAQKRERNLHVEDGWIYFIYGWTLVIEEVFHIKIDPQTFGRLERIAHTIR
ncbi:MAG: shikimate dehydrogenase [Clostridiales bacterium]|nr:shikimate dehydrogenase [Clostridiales bacterium]